jgi:hypothetical protein
MVKWTPGKKKRNDIISRSRDGTPFYCCGVKKKKKVITSLDGIRLSVILRDREVRTTEFSAWFKKGGEKQGGGAFYASHHDGGAQATSCTYLDVRPCWTHWWWFAAQDLTSRRAETENSFLCVIQLNDSDALHYDGVQAVPSPRSAPRPSPRPDTFSIDFPWKGVVRALLSAPHKEVKAKSRSESSTPDRH